MNQPTTTANLIAALLALTVPEIHGKLAELSDADLAAALEAEKAGGKRKGVIEPIELLQLERADNAEHAAKVAAAAEEAAKAASTESAPPAAPPSDPADNAAPPAATTDALAPDAAPPAKRPAWQDPEYTGPLHAGQAAWRHAHLKGGS